MLRVCIADDHSLVREGARAALEGAGFEVLGEASTGDEAVALVDALEPDVVLMDLRMPGRDSVSCVQAIRERHPHVRVVMLSASEHPGDIQAALDAGASAYVGKRIAPADLASVLRQVLEGTIPHRGRPADDAAGERAGGAGGGDGALTERERTILAALARGLSTKAISRELWISEKTVKFHLTNLYRKLGVPNRASAVRYAVEQGLAGDPRTISV